MIIFLVEEACMGMEKIFGLISLSQLGFKFIIDINVKFFKLKCFFEKLLAPRPHFIQCQKLFGVVCPTGLLAFPMSMFLEVLLALPRWALIDTGRARDSMDPVGLGICRGLVFEVSV